VLLISFLRVLVYRNNHLLYEHEMEEIPLQPLAKGGTNISATSISSPEHAISMPSRRNSYEILGMRGVIFVVFGSATIGATLGFFVFLWYSDESTGFWRGIILANWGVRSIPPPECFLFPT